jgi:UDP-N-acetylmuramoylalanine--D-glutamate ligase
MEYINEKLQEFNTYLKNRRVAIIGLGVSNTPLLEYLHNLGSDVTVFDKRTPDKIEKEVLELVARYRIEAFLGENYLENIIFRSPSCMPNLPEIQAELERGAILTTEIEMVLELCPGRVIGITGSDGKTTTTSLIYEIVKEKGYRCFLGGNIGMPLFTQIADMRPEDIVVLELSSFQLMNMKISPDIAVVTNVTPNHLDIHSSYQEYIDAKTNIFKHQNDQGIVVLNYDNDITKDFAKQAKGKVIYFSSQLKLDDGYILDNQIIKSCQNGLRRHLLDTKDVILRGRHNYENICTALAATESLVDIDTQIRAVSKFKGVEHRIEYIREIDGVKWYNDSVASSPTRTIVALDSFQEKIVLIAGGYDKHLEYEPLAKPIVDHVSTLILLGQTAEKIDKAVRRQLEKENKTLPIYRCNSLEETIRIAKEQAKPGEIVILSPASASFDMFKNAVERGKIFKELVHKL